MKSIQNRNGMYPTPKALNDQDSFFLEWSFLELQITEKIGKKI